MESTVVTRGKKILFLVTEDWYFCSHRLPIARSARDAGMDVVVVTRVENHGEAIRKEGFRLVSLPWRRRSKNPFREIVSLVRLVLIYRRERPDIVHHVAVKPVVVGSVAARLVGAPRQVNAVAGFGYVFTSASLGARLLRPLFRGAFRWALNRPQVWVIVQNPDDRDALIRARVSAPERIRLIRGSGVDLERFSPAQKFAAGDAGSPARDRASGENDRTLVVTMVARMLWTKGVAEMVDAARLLRDRGANARVWLVGAPDAENPESVPESALRRWHEEGVVEWKGHVDDIVSVWKQTDVAVLPSYREGLPKTILEAAACGLPAVVTDVPGCREIVRQDENGFLVPRGEAKPLADAIEALLGDERLRQQMGARGRELAEVSFGEEIVVEQTLSLYRSMLSA